MFIKMIIISCLMAAHVILVRFLEKFVIINVIIILLTWMRPFMPIYSFSKKLHNKIFYSVDQVTFHSNTSYNTTFIIHIYRLFDDLLTFTELCNLPRIVGFCLGAIPRFAYNATSKQCEQFLYGGCGENANSFSSFESCFDKCSSQSLKPGVIPPDSIIPDQNIGKYRDIIMVDSCWGI